MIDFFNLKNKVDFLFLENGKVYAGKREDQILKKAEISFNSFNIYENDFIISVSNFLDVENIKNCKLLTRSINGEIYYDEKIANLGLIDTTVLHDGKIYSNLSQKLKKVLIVEAQVNE